MWSSRARLKSRPEPAQALDGALLAPASWRAVEFISDLHLSPALPRTLQGLARYFERSDADAVFLLGDIFEVWIGDDAISQDFEAACVDLLHKAGQSRQLFFMAGNRDFLLGQTMADASAMTLLPDPTVLQAFGLRLLLSHGDAFCIADASYQRFRAEVRGSAWQQAFLAQPLTERARIAAELRQRSRERQQDPELWAEPDAASCCHALRERHCSVLLHGHTHRPASHELADGLSRWVLADWELDATTPRADCLRLDASGLQRHQLANLLA